MPCRQFGAGREREIHRGGEIHATEIHRLRTHIHEFDKLRPAGNRVVMNFGDHQILRTRWHGHDEQGLSQCRQPARCLHPCLHAGIGVDDQRGTVDLRRGRGEIVQTKGIGTIHGEINRSLGCAHGELETGGDVPAILIETGGLHRGKEVYTPESRQGILVILLPVNGFLPDDFRQPVGFAGVGDVLMRVPPARGFTHDAFVDFVLPAFPAGVILGRRQQASIETKRLHTIPKIPAEMGVLPQLVVKSPGRAGVRGGLNQLPAVGRGP